MLLLIPNPDWNVQCAVPLGYLYSHLSCFSLGKTTILYKFKLNETVPSIPTIGFNVETLTPVKGLTMTVWDMGGQERMRALWRMYLRGTDGKAPISTRLSVIDDSDYNNVRDRAWFSACTRDNAARGLSTVQADEPCFISLLA